MKVKSDLVGLMVMDISKPIMDNTEAHLKIMLDMGMANKEHNNCSSKEYFSMEIVRKVS